MRRDIGYGVRKTAPKVVKFLGVGERQIRVIASDGTPDRFGDVLVPSGCDLTNYRRNPVVLAQHDADQPIARCASITADSTAVSALIEFPAAGVSAVADLYVGLLKERVLGAVSVGFLPISRTPLAAGGWRYSAWELIELSIVSVPANPAALVTERSFANARRARDLRRAEQVRARTAAARRDQSVEAQRTRAAALKARLSPDPWADWLKRQEQEQREHRDRLAALDAVNRAMLSW